MLSYLFLTVLSVTSLLHSFFPSPLSIQFLCFCFQEVSFFRVNLSPIVDNPDQRLTQDIERLCTAASQVVVPLVLSPFKIGRRAFYYV